MASVDEIRHLISESRSRIEQDRAALLRMMQELARTRVVIERATPAYIVSLGTLKSWRAQGPMRTPAPIIPLCLALTATRETERKRLGTVQEPVIFPADSAVAATGSFLQTFSIFHRDGASYVMDISGFLEHRGSDRDSWPVYAEHLR
jgi:hypothetical protein